MMSGKDADTQEWLARLVQGEGGTQEEQASHPPAEIVESSGETGALVLPGRDYELGKTGLSIHRELSYDEWCILFLTLHDMHEATRWALGDAINWAEKQPWGEMYAQAIETTGLSGGYLRNLAWVAREFDLSSRNDKLSVAHHLAVAPLEPEERTYWLEMAARDELSVSELRHAMRNSHNSHSEGPHARQENTDDEQEIVFLPPHITNPGTCIRAIGEAIAATYDMIGKVPLDDDRRERVQESLTVAQEALQDALDALENGGEQ